MNITLRNLPVDIQYFEKLRKCVLLLADNLSMNPKIGLF